MPPAHAGKPSGTFLEALDEVSDAVESGAGLPSVTRAASRALGASVIVLDASTSVLAVACASSEDERVVMAGEADTEAVDLLGRIADHPEGLIQAIADGTFGITKRPPDGGKGLDGVVELGPDAYNPALELL